MLVVFQPYRGVEYNIVAAVWLHIKINTRRCYRISILMISCLGLLIASVHVHVPPFMYNPDGHVISGYFNIIKNTSPRDVFAKVPTNLLANFLNCDRY